jgi:hypothetical protein
MLTAGWCRAGGGKEARKFRMARGECGIVGAGALPERRAIRGGQIEQPSDQKFV